MTRILRGEIYWIVLDPTMGSEIAKKRPALIISNNIANHVCHRVIIAPITSKASKIFQFEAPIHLKGIQGKILLDQIRAVDKIRIDQKVGECDEETLNLVNQALKLVLHLS